jgi:hypothetical protein
VLIVEDNPDGHRLSYVGLLASAATAGGDHVIVAASETVVGSQEFPVHMGKIGPEVELRTVEDFSLKGVEKLCRELKIDHAVIPDGDSMAYQLSKGHPWTWHGTISALVMRERGQTSRFPGAALAKTVTKRLLLHAANLRPRVQIRVLKSATWRGYALLPISRDPVILIGPGESAGSLAAPILANDYFWFGIVGKVGHRKNLPLVAASIAALGRPDVALVVAGQVEDGVLQQAEASFERIRSFGGRVEVIDRLLTDHEMDNLVGEIDCVVLAHSNEGPSGILGKATAAGTRIVASGASTLRSDCRHIGEGAEWVKMKQHLLSRAFARAISKPRPTASQIASTAEFTSGLLGYKS